LLRIEGERDGDCLGSRIVGLADVNGDCVPDILVGSMMGGRERGSDVHAPGQRHRAGEWWVCSGKDGSKIYGVSRPAGEDWTAQAFVRLSDVDSDGCEDYAVGLAQERRVSIRSGRTGKELRRLECPETTGMLGYALDVGPGASGVECAELVVAAPARHGERTGPGVIAFSVSTWERMWVREAVTGVGGAMEATVASLGDVNGDGLGDWTLGVASAGGDRRGVVQLVTSGSDGRVLWEVFGAANDRCGAVVVSAGDLDGDKVSDCIIGCPWASGSAERGGAGVVAAVSGRDGSVLWVYGGSREHGPSQSPRASGNTRTK
jgi:hypothetical protein